MLLLVALCLCVSRDHLNLHFDEDGVDLISADHLATGVDCGSIDGLPGEDGTTMVREIEKAVGPTTTSVKFAKMAPALSVVERRRRTKQRAEEGGLDGGFDEMEFEEEVEDEDEGEEGSKRKDERTWLQKNWMLCLAGGMMVMNLLGSALGDPPQRQQQRRAAGGRAAGGGS